MMKGDIYIGGVRQIAIGSSYKVPQSGQSFVYHVGDAADLNKGEPPSYTVKTTGVNSGTTNIDVPVCGLNTLLARNGDKFIYDSTGDGVLNDSFQNSLAIVGSGSNDGAYTAAYLAGSGLNCFETGEALVPEPAGATISVYGSANGLGNIISASNTVSFTSAGKIVSDSGAGITDPNPGDLVWIGGSAANSGLKTVDSIITPGTSFSILEAVTTEIAGPAITLSGPFALIVTRATISFGDPHIGYFEDSAVGGVFTGRIIGDSLTLHGYSAGDYAGVVVEKTSDYIVVLCTADVTTEVAGTYITISLREVMSNAVVLDNNTGLTWMRTTPVGLLPWRNAAYDYTLHPADADLAITAPAILTIVGGGRDSTLQTWEYYYHVRVAQ
jgi:hypothetical protein